MIIRLLFVILGLLIFASCQVKETKSNGELISGHLPTSNGFTVVSPLAKTYVTGDVISFKLSFPFVVTVTGVPQLSVNIGGTTRVVNYTAGDGTRSLTFDYTVVLADNDTDGVNVTSLALNGGTLKFDDNGTITDCNVATVTSTNLASVLVDNTAPTISGFAFSTVPGFYRVGQSLNMRMTFSEAVYVTGTPRIAVTFTTGGAVFFNYNGGSGTTSLSFTYTITNTAADINGYDTISSPIQLNGGTILDNAGNVSSTDFSAYVAAATAYSSSIPFDGRLVYVTDIVAPANGTYLSAQNLDFTVHFDRPVNVTGTPFLNVTIGTTVRQANYLSGATTNTLIFRYTTVPGDNDADGIAIASSLSQGAGNIAGVAAPTQSYFLVGANNNFNVPVTTGILVGAVQPQVTSVTLGADSTIPLWGSASADNIWIVGQQLTISLAFNTAMWVNQTSGVPRIPLTIGGTTRYATYLSGGTGQTTLVFRYIVVDGDADGDGTIAIGSIDLNGGSVYDIQNTNTLLGLPVAGLSAKVDGIRPIISSVTPPANGTYSTVAGVNHVNMLFTVNWSEAVNYNTVAPPAVYLPILIGGSTLNFTYLSGNQTTAIIHRAGGLAGYNDSDGVDVVSPYFSTASISDQAGNPANVYTFTPPNTSSIFVDTNPPTVSSITPPANGTYTAGQNLDFSVTFNESVTTNVSAGFPKINVTIGGSTYGLVPTANATATTHTFRYTVAVNDNDSDGIATGTSVSSSGAGYVRDVGLNNVAGTFTAPNTSLVLVDALSPSVSSVTPPANGTYQSGDTLTFVVNYSENVIVTGTPRIQVAAQTGTLNLDYVSGSGTTALTFQYTVTGSDFDLDGLPSSVTTISLNGGTMKDASNNNASLIFGAQNLSNVFVTYPNNQVWVTSSFVNKAPVAAGVSVTSSGVATTQACGTGICRTFDGDDALNLSNAVNTVTTVYIVFKTSSTIGNYDLVTTDVTLTDQGTSYDLAFQNANIDLNGVTYSGITAAAGLAGGTTNILQVAYTSTQNYSVGNLIPTTTLGAIGEVLMFTGALSGAQKTQILTYLNAKY